MNIYPGLGVGSPARLRAHVLLLLLLWLVAMFVGFAVVLIILVVGQAIILLQHIALHLDKKWRGRASAAIVDE